MDGYSFWSDLFDTYQSLPDWLKFMWLIVPPGFVLALVVLIRRPRSTGLSVPAVLRGSDGGTAIDGELHDGGFEPPALSVPAEPEPRRLR